MINPLITNNDLGSVLLEGIDFEDATLTLAGTTLSAGTILARTVASEKLVVFLKGGVAAVDGVPRTVLTYDVELAAPGDLTVRVPIHAKVMFEKLIIDADGDNSNVDANVRDQLNEIGITVLTFKESNILDNQ